MIRLAQDSDTDDVRRMWKSCFGDSDSFMDIYFRLKYRPENTLIYFMEGQAAASVQLLPYTMTFWGETINIVYLSGLCTLPGYRGMGCASNLIAAGHGLLAGRGIPLSVLVPATESLYEYYGRFGYERVFDEGETEIPLREILGKYHDPESAYGEFDAMFRGVDFCVQKGPADFRAIAEDYINEGCPAKKNIAGAARIIDPQALLDIYARSNADISIDIRITGFSADGSDAIYSISGGSCSKLNETAGWNNAAGITERAKGNAAIIECDIRTLCSLLMGYRTDNTAPELNGIFPVHHPVMNLMLE